jgi:large subunit ribosomal protein L22
MEFTASKMYARVSPQKARLVLDLIKGRRVEEARNTLLFTNKRIAPVVSKLLTSALDNAKYLIDEKGLDVDVDNLYVKNAISNEGPRMKRIRPAPMGRAYRYQRRIAHLHIILAEKNAAMNAAKAAAAGEVSAAPAKGKTAGKSKKSATKKSAAKKTAAKR